MDLSRFELGSQPLILPTLTTIAVAFLLLRAQSYHERLNVDATILPLAPFCIFISLLFQEQDHLWQTLQQILWVSEVLLLSSSNTGRSSKNFSFGSL